MSRHEVSPNPYRRLSQEQIEKIVRLRVEEKLSLRVISLRFGVTQARIGQIVQKEVKENEIS